MTRFEAEDGNGSGAEKSPDRLASQIDGGPRRGLTTLCAIDAKARPASTFTTRGTRPEGARATEGVLIRTETTVVERSTGRRSVYYILLSLPSIVNREHCKFMWKSAATFHSPIWQTTGLRHWTQRYREDGQQRQRPRGNNRTQATSPDRLESVGSRAMLRNDMTASRLPSGVAYWRI